MRYKNIAGRFFGLVTKHACDRRTDSQNYDTQDRVSIAASRGKTALSQDHLVQVIGHEMTQQFPDRPCMVHDGTVYIDQSRARP